MCCGGCYAGLYRLCAHEIEEKAAVEALRAAKEYLLDGGPCHHEADGAADGSDCAVCKLMVVIDAAIAGKGE